MSDQTNAVWRDYLHQVYKLNLTLGGNDESFLRSLDNMGICRGCKMPLGHGVPNASRFPALNVWSKNRCTCASE